MTNAAVYEIDSRTEHMLRSLRARKARARQVNRQYTILAATLICAIAVVILMSGVPSHAAEENHPFDHKYYANVLITADCGIEELTAQYADPAHYADAEAYIEEVAQINHVAFHGTRIPSATPGTRLIIPYYSDVFK